MFLRRSVINHPLSLDKLARLTIRLVSDLFVMVFVTLKKLQILRRQCCLLNSPIRPSNACVEPTSAIKTLKQLVLKLKPPLSHLQVKMMMIVVMMKMYWWWYLTVYWKICVDCKICQICVNCNLKGSCLGKGSIKNASVIAETNFTFGPMYKTNLFPL